MSRLRFVFQLACSGETIVLVIGSCYCERGKEVETEKLTHGLTFHRGPNWVALDKDRRNKVIFSSCSQWTKDPVCQAMNPAPPNTFFLPSLIGSRVKIDATEVNRVSTVSHQHNRGYRHTITCVLH